MVLIGFLRMRAFLTTLVSLIIFRAIVDILLLKYALAISSVFPDSDVWAAIGEGAFFGFPYTIIATALIFVFTHIVISRMRAGWHLVSVGGARRSALMPASMSGARSSSPMSSAVFCAP